MESLLEQAWSGDEEALADILCLHNDRLAARIRPQIPTELRKSISEEDILQDVFISVFKAFRTLNKCSTNAFAAWLDSIATNQVVDSVRKLRANKRGGSVREVSHVNRPSTGSVVQMAALLVGNEATPSKNVARVEATAALTKAIQELPENQRTAVELRCLSGLSLQDVATQMNRTEDSVRNLIHRAKATLRREMRTSELWLEKK